MAPHPIIQTEKLHRVYEAGGESVHAVNDVTMSIPSNKITAIIGRSGAGKTTLLNLISGLDHPSEGDVWIDGQNLYNMSEDERITLRREKIGFIFQSFGLMPLLSAAENVSLPLRMQKVDNRKRQLMVKQALEWVELSNRASHRPYELSGGEQQRVGIARALVTKPQIILADEPTGQLDSQTGRRILEIMGQLTREQGITMVIVTHDDQVVEAADFVYRMHDGKLVETRENAAISSRI